MLIKDKCLTREKDEMEEIFLQDFGKKPEEMLREIEPEPVAAASLAQVLKIQYTGCIKKVGTLEYFEKYKFYQKMFQTKVVGFKKFYLLAISF